MAGVVPNLRPPVETLLLSPNPVFCADVLAIEAPKPSGVDPVNPKLDWAIDAPKLGGAKEYIIILL